LRAAGVSFRVLAESRPEPAARVDEKPRAYVLRAAAAKRSAAVKLLAEKIAEDTVITADTVVALRGVVFGKPRTRDEARRMLSALSAQKHDVYTAVALAHGKVRQSRVVRSTVSFRPLSIIEIERYLRSNEWRGKAGAYAIQGRAASFVHELHGSLTNVIGFPLEEALHLLAQVRKQS